MKDVDLGEPTSFLDHVYIRVRVWKGSAAQEFTNSWSTCWSHESTQTDPNLINKLILQSTCWSTVDQLVDFPNHFVDQQLIILLMSMNLSINSWSTVDQRCWFGQPKLCASPRRKLINLLTNSCSTFGMKRFQATCEKSTSWSTYWILWKSTCWSTFWPLRASVPPNLTNSPESTHVNNHPCESWRKLAKSANKTMHLHPPPLPHLLELELPRLLAPELLSNWYSKRFFNFRVNMTSILIYWTWVGRS